MYVTKYSSCILWVYYVAVYVGTVTMYSILAVYCGYIGTVNYVCNLADYCGYSDYVF